MEVASASFSRFALCFLTRCFLRRTLASRDWSSFSRLAWARRAWRSALSLASFLAAVLALEASLAARTLRGLSSTLVEVASGSAVCLCFG